jgi:Uma2 family endonuclease
MGVALSDMGGTVSREAFRRWYEAQQSGRFERIDGVIVAMAPERAAHVIVKSAVWLALRRAVAEARVPCQAMADGMTVEAGESDYQPDALVNCGPRLSNDAVAASNPIVVVEVLSPGTASADTGAKLAGYFQVPSIAHYLIIHPTKRIVTHHRRSGSGIETRILVGGAIELDPPGIRISVEEIYEAD